MNHKERIDAVMNHQPVDRTPFALVDGGAWVSMHEQKNYGELYHLPDAGASVFVEYMDKINTDTVSGVNGVFTACLNAFGCDIDVSKIGNPVNTDKCITDGKKEIPALDKSDIRDKLLANDFVQCMLKQCEETKKIVGDDKYIHVDVAGPFTMANVMYGTAEYMLLLMKNKELAGQLLDYATEASIEMFRLLRERGADIAFIAEPCASGNMLNPKMMNKYAVPGYERLMKELDYDYYIAHICGGSLNRVTTVRDAGLNAFSCDYAADLDQALIDADGKMVIFGNMDPAGNVLMGEPQEVYDEACGRISPLCYTIKQTIPKKPSLIAIAEGGFSLNAVAVPPLCRKISSEPALSHFPFLTSRRFSDKRYINTVSTVGE